jgi:hypothetical protein
MNLRGRPVVSAYLRTFGRTCTSTDLMKTGWGEGGGARNGIPLVLCCRGQFRNRCRTSSILLLWATSCYLPICVIFVRGGSWEGIQVLYLQTSAGSSALLRFYEVVFLLRKELPLVGLFSCSNVCGRWNSEDRANFGIYEQSKVQ